MVLEEDGHVRRLVEEARMVERDEDEPPPLQAL
jgi:hypothetical protein